MKIARNTIYVMAIICLLSLGGAIVLEYYDFDTVNFVYFDGHSNFFINIALGVFASSILVLISSIVQYLTEKKKYYIKILRILNSILYHSLEIINIMKNYSQNSNISKCFDSFGLQYTELIGEFSDFIPLFKKNQNDKLIESIVSETIKFYMIQEELLKLSKKLKENEISEDDYRGAFDVVREEMISSFMKEFEEYQSKIKSITKKLVKNRKIEKIY